MLNNDLRIFELELQIIDLQKEVIKYKYDYLTGLKLRIDFEEELFDLFSNKADFYLIMVDINNLHNINRDYGYHEGDLVIKKVSRIIKKYFPSLSYRIGGDEFIILEENLDFRHREFVKEIKRYCTISVIKKTKKCKSSDNLIKKADKVMIKIKTDLYNETNIDRRNKETKDKNVI